MSVDTRRRLHSGSDYYAPRPEPDEVDLHAEVDELELSRLVSLEKREANHVLLDRAGDDPRPVPFLCECGSPTCFARVDLMVADYDRMSRFGFIGGAECPPGPRLLRAAA